MPKDLPLRGAPSSRGRVQYIRFCFAQAPVANRNACTPPQCASDNTGRCQRKALKPYVRRPCRLRAHGPPAPPTTTASQECSCITWEATQPGAVHHHTHYLHAQVLPPACTMRLQLPAVLRTASNSPQYTAPHSSCHPTCTITLQLPAVRVPVMELPSYHTLNSARARAQRCHEPAPPAP